MVFYPGRRGNSPKSIHCFDEQIKQIIPVTTNKTELKNKVML